MVGVPDDRWGERVVAIVQARPGAAPSLADLQDHARSQIAGYKLPRDLVGAPEPGRALAVGQGGLPVGQGRRMKSMTDAGTEDAVANVADTGERA